MVSAFASLYFRSSVPYVQFFAFSQAKQFQNASAQRNFEYSRQRTRLQATLTSSQTQSIVQEHEAGTDEEVAISVDLLIAKVFVDSGRLLRKHQLQLARRETLLDLGDEIEAQNFVGSLARIFRE